MRISFLLDRVDRLGPPNFVEELPTVLKYSDPDSNSGAFLLIRPCRVMVSLDSEGAKSGGGENRGVEEIDGTLEGRGGDGDGSKKGDGEGN